MVGPWMLSSQNGLDHGRHHGWAMDPLFSGHGRHHDWAMDDHGRQHGWAMEVEETHGNTTNSDDFGTASKGNTNTDAIDVFDT